MNRIRWMIRRDLGRVESLDMAENGTDRAWSQGCYCDRLCHRNCIGIVFTGPDGEAIGAAVYELRRHQLKLLRLVGCGGAELLERLENKLGTHRRRYASLPAGRRRLHWPLTVPADWRTSDVTALAACGAPACVLADALEEAGCDNPALLTTLRTPGPLAEAVAGRLLTAA